MLLLVLNERGPRLFHFVFGQFAFVEQFDKVTVIGAGLGHSMRDL